MLSMYRFVQAVSMVLSLLLAAAVVAAQDSEATPVLGGPESGTVNFVEANGIEIAYQRVGPEKGEAILFIAGIGQQLIEWPSELVNTLTEAGYQVILFDNRDVGLSTHFDEAGPPNWLAIFTALATGQPPPVAYTYEDMARDAAGLLDALGIEQAHLVGASGGAIIAPAFAATYPERALSLTLLMANSGSPAYPIPADPERLASVPAAPPADSPVANIIDYRVQAEQALGSPGYPTDEETLRRRITQAVERAYNPVGADRQGAAVLTASADDMRAMLESIDAPTVVIHGDADPLIPYQLGEDVAGLIPGAQFVLIEGMGHEIPDQLVPRIAEAILIVAARA